MILTCCKERITFIISVCMQIFSSNLCNPYIRSSTDSSHLSHPDIDLQVDSSEENNAEESEDGEEEESLPVTRTVEPQVLQRLESKFLKLFGMSKRPSKKNAKDLKVPKYLLDLYAKQSGNDLPTSNLNLPGRHTRTANTVRTFYLDTGKHIFTK
jgi:hypothetical protein